MTTGPFQIESLPEGRLIRVRLHGFWTLSGFEGFRRVLTGETRRLLSTPGPHRVLVDVGGFAIQTQEVFGLCRDLIVAADHPAERIAIVGGSGLARMQFRRVAVHSNTRYFDDAAMADTWLAEELRCG